MNSASTATPKEIILIGAVRAKWKSKAKYSTSIYFPAAAVGIEKTSPDYMIEDYRCPFDVETELIEQVVRGLSNDPVPTFSGDWIQFATWCASMHPELMDHARRIVRVAIQPLEIEARAARALQVETARARLERYNDLLRETRRDLNQ